MKHLTSNVAVDGLRAADLLSLYRHCTDRRFRDAHRLVAVEGVRFVLRAHQAGLPFRGLITSRRLLTSRAGREVAEELRARGVPEVSTTPEQFRQISMAKRASGLAALVEQRTQPLTSLIEHRGLWLGVRRIDAPGNLGTIYRSVEAAGGAGVLLFGAAVDVYEPAVVRASMGAIFEVPSVRTTHRRLARVRSRAGLQVLAASPEGGRCYDEVDLTTPTVILLGHERSGLTAEERELVDEVIRVPMQGRQSSLNVASAAAVLVFEALRQRRGHRKAAARTAAVNVDRR